MIFLTSWVNFYIIWRMSIPLGEYVQHSPLLGDVVLNWTIAGMPAVLEKQPDANIACLSILQRTDFLNDCLIVGEWALIAWLIGSGFNHITSPLATCGGSPTLTGDGYSRTIALTQWGAAGLTLKNLFSALDRSTEIGKQIAQLTPSALTGVTQFEV